MQVVAGQSTRVDKQELTLLIERYRSGDDAAFAALVEEVYEQLRRIAHAQLSGHRRDAVVNTTVIVHEAYFRLREQDREIWQSRSHFMAVAARAMRQIIIDFARRQGAAKRGSGLQHVDLESTQIGTEDSDIATLLDLDAALTALADQDGQAAQLFEYRFFGGMTDQEAASILGMSLRSTQREWQKVKAYFAHALS